MAPQARLQGVFTPLLVPLDAQDRVNEAELRRFVDWLIESGVHGLYPNGSTGEFTRLSAGERRLVARITCEQARGRVPVLAGAAEANVKETIAACELYHTYGARAVAIVSPIYYKLSPESVYTYFREIALHSPVDVTLYNIPLFASPITLATIQRLAELERIVGIKDSSGDVAFMMRMISAIRPSRPDFTFLTGWDCVLVPMLVAGADGGTNAASNVVPELMRLMYDTARAGRLDQAMRLQTRVLELFDHMLDHYEFPDGFRAGVELRGFNFGRSRQPQSETQQQRRAELQSILDCLLAERGPCPAPGDAHVEQITLEVLRTLRERGLL
jgi:4-hydroxy-tetrahydrodipicolinate synthase